MPNPKITSLINDHEAFDLGYTKAVALLHDCVCDEGFLASPTNTTNYRRIWGRDGVVITLAALLTRDSELVEASKRTLMTLALNQGPHGEIPSNIDPATGRISYGGSVGRVDTNLWFIIGCGEYWLATGDDEFLEKLVPVIKEVNYLLGAWEFNNRGLIYVPLTGDWADEYLHNGYILYDQLLYLQAQRTIAKMHASLHNSTNHMLKDKINHMRHLIQSNYWIDNNDIPDDAYHEILYKKGLDASAQCIGYHWMPSFSPSGYSYRFDAFANVLVSLFDVADDTQRSKVDHYINENIANESISLLPAFHPVIKPVDMNWKDLKVMFTYNFKNNPYEYHNGGLWPMVTGFYVADLARRQKHDLAIKYLQGIHSANAMAMEDEPWGFPEFVHGSEYTVGGTRHQGWSAAGAIIGHHALQGQQVFKIDGNIL